VCGPDEDEIVEVRQCPRCGNWSLVPLKKIKNKIEHYCPYCCYDIIEHDGE